MSGSGRAVRIPKSAGPGPPPTPPGAPAVDVRPNTAGTQRVLRLSVLYVVLLLALFALLASLAASAPGGGGTGARADLLIVGVLAALLGAGGVLFTLTQAPRAIEIGETSTIVIGRWGRRRTFPPAERLAAHEVRHYRAGLLSSAPVVAIELTSEEGRRSSFLLEKGLLPPKAA